MCNIKSFMNLIALLAIGFILTTGYVQAQDNPLPTLEYDGIERTYDLYVPDTLPNDPALVIALHPTGSSGKAMAALTDFSTAADDNAFIVAYPNTEGVTWAHDARDDTLPDDVGFIGALIDQLTGEYAVGSVYVAGFGSGGLMAMRLACEVPTPLDGVIVVGALLWDYHRDNCPEATTHAVDVLIVHGTNDAFYEVETSVYRPIFGGESSTILGEHDTLEFWAARNGCDLESASDEHNNLRLYHDCPDEVRVALYRVLGGGQNWSRVGDYELNQFGVDTTAIVSAFIAGNSDWATKQDTPFKEQPRTYVFYVPSSYDPGEPMPVVMLLHGRFGTGAGMASLSDMNLVAEENGFIALYPDGLRSPGGEKGDNAWNYTYGIPLYITGDYSDTQFLSDLIADLSQDVNIDPQRIYVAGFSNGGFMVNRLACDDPDQYAGFASVAGSGYFRQFETCDHDVHVPFLVMHGTADNNIRWDGLTSRLGDELVYTSQPVEQVVGFWAFHNGCAQEADVEDIPAQDERTQVRIIRIADCPADGSVVLYAIVNGGHNWPGFPDRIVSSVAGNVNGDINASEELWKFFSLHTRNGANESS